MTEDRGILINAKKRRPLFRWPFSMRKDIDAALFPEIYFIRHAESTYEAKKGSIFNKILCQSLKPLTRLQRDPQLTAKGRWQCKRLKRSAKSEIEDADIVLVSPLVRCLETADKGLPFIDPKKIIVDPICRDVFRNVSDVGTSLEDLKQKYPKFDFSKVEDGFWVSHLTETGFHNVDIVVNIGEVIPETERHFRKRILHLIEKIRTMRDKKKIVIVSHVMVHKQIMKMCGREITFCTPPLGKVTKMNSKLIFEAKLEQI